MERMRGREPSFVSQMFGEDRRRRNRLIVRDAKDPNKILLNLDSGQATIKDGSVKVYNRFDGRERAFSLQNVTIEATSPSNISFAEETRK